MIMKAIEKLCRECKEAKALGQAARFMAKPVERALCDFCEQDEEFAQAVVQGGSFADCMKAVERGCGTALSDVEAYRRAVRFYFPGAEIRVQMTIDLIGAAAVPEPISKSGGIVLDLADFL